MKPVILDLSTYKVMFASKRYLEMAMEDLDSHRHIYTTKGLVDARGELHRPILYMANVIFDKKTKRYTKHRALGTHKANEILEFADV